MTPNKRIPSLYRWLRWLLLLLGGVGLLLLAAWRLTQPDILHRDDTVEYWAAGQLNATRQNPYDPTQLLLLERQAGRPLEDPLMMWNPPWLLALVMPLGLLPYPLARALWFLLHLGVVFFSSIWLANEARTPSPARQGLAILFGLSFGPTLHALKAGQVTPLMLLGLIGFLHYFQRQRWMMAGAMAALGLIKPHLLYLFIVALVLDALAHRRWGILLGFLGALAMSSGLAMVANPSVWAQYIYSATHYPPQDWATPTLGGLLRFLLGVEHFWLQFLPSGFGLIWLFFHWRRHRHSWQWEEQLPLLALVSVTTAAYGWSFDLVVALVALIPALIRLLETRHRLKAVALLLAYVVVDAISLFTSLAQFFYWWMGPFLLVWYLLAQHTGGSAWAAGEGTPESASPHRRRPFHGLGPEEWRNLGLAALATFYAIWVGMEIVRNNLFLWVLGADYLAFWSAGYVANRYGYAAIYDLNRMAEVQAWAVASSNPSLIVVSPMQFLYLPVFAVPFQVLARIPLRWSFPVWVLLNLVGFFLYLHFWIRSVAPDFRQGHLRTMLLLSYPVFLNLVGGQVGFALMVSVGQFLHEIRAGRPFRAGLWLGGLLLKPQALVLMVPALLIQRMGRALLGLGIAASLIAAASVGLAGTEGIRRLLDLWIGGTRGMLGNNPEYMTNWRMVGTHLSRWIPPTLAWALALTGLGVTLGLGLLLWRRPLRPDHPTFAAAVLGTLAATAAISWHTHPHMLVMFIPPIAYLYVKGQLPERLLSMWTFALPPAVFARLGFALLAQRGILTLHPMASGLPEGTVGLLVNLCFLAWAFRKIRVLPA